MFIKILCLLLNCVIVLCFTLSEKELVFVHVIFRHGDRTPIKTYPNDPYLNTSFWPTGWGQLTDRGKIQQYELGKWLRRRYNDFLPSSYSRDDIYIQSTDVDRTLMSAATNLAGLYEPTKNNWNSDIKWQPIPVHTIPEIRDFVLAAKKPCPKHQALLKNVKESSQFRAVNEEYKTTYKFLTEKCGLNVSEVSDVVDIFDALYIDELYGLPLPDWASTVYPQPLQHLSEVWFIMPCYTPEMSRLKIGPLLQNILKHFEQKKTNEISQKMWIYSGHDTTIANLLKALGLFDEHIPPYCSAILFELHRREGEYFVELHYKNTTAEPLTFHIPGCQRNCRLDQFKQLTASLIPLDWESECNT